MPLGEGSGLMHRSGKKQRLLSSVRSGTQFHLEKERFPFTHQFIICELQGGSLSGLSELQKEKKKNIPLMTAYMVRSSCTKHSGFIKCGKVFFFSYLAFF